MNDIKIKSAFKSYGAIIESQEGVTDLLDFSTPWINQNLSEYGALIFRNFSVSLDKFTKFIASHSSRVTNDPARKASSSNAQLIQAGDVEMGLHIENGNLPFLPEAQWFYCEKAAREGSQTTLCDGFFVWNQLSDKAKRLFSRKRLQFSRNIPEHLWKKYLSTELEISLEEVGDSTLESVNKTVEGQQYQIKPDGSVYSRYKVWAVRPTQFSKRLAFANSMLGPSVNYEPPRITWEDGSMIAPSLWDEVMEVTESCTDDIQWADGDVVLVDNTRLMHGRRKVLDQQRRMFGGQSYLRKITRSAV